MNPSKKAVLVISVGVLAIALFILTLIPDNVNYIPDTSQFIADGSPCPCSGNHAYIPREWDTVPFIPATTPYQDYVRGLMECYHETACEPDNTTWEEITALDDEIWNFISGLENVESDSVIGKRFMLSIQRELYELDSTFGWTDHYSYDARCRMHIHYWRFKMKQP